MRDPYFDRPEVSNSDLTSLRNQLYPRDMPNPEQAYKFGTLIDNMLTEPEKVDYTLYKCDGEQHEVEDFEKANRMKIAFLKDPFCKSLVDNSTPQKVMVKRQKFIVDGFEYWLNTRCKWDIWMDSFGWGGDIKSTTATTHKQFVDALYHFDYDRQRAFYMTLGESDQDVLIGISKVNFKVFKVPIKRGDDLFKSGMDKVNDLTFRYWTLFGDI